MIIIITVQGTYRCISNIIYCNRGAGVQSTVPLERPEKYKNPTIYLLCYIPMTEVQIRYIELLRKSLERRAAEKAHTKPPNEATPQSPALH